MKRREFLGTAAGAFAQAETPSRPNILWLTCEDMSPNLGCYGDPVAKTPAIDRFAARSLRYRNVWSCAPVCAPARTTIISGMYPTATGSENMRCLSKMAPGQAMFPQLLREAGYYTSNNAKEDYNLALSGKVWDESSPQAHWRKRSGQQPFFSVFNFLITHESQIRSRPHKRKQDPRKVRIPAYLPDLPEIRQDWAQYYDRIAEMDGMVQRTLDELQADGLADTTIVMFYSDHGAGMPRSKRWPYNSGLQVPMIVHIPAAFRHLAPQDYKGGAWSERMVSFVDLAPTLLSLAGVPKPDYHQGFAFLGNKIEDEQEYIYGFRGRMDERIDLVRSVRDKRYVYIRNYMPHRIYGQHLAYMFEMPTTRKWKEAFEAGKTTDEQSHFWKTKASEELYDLDNDRDEVHNLAYRPNAEQKQALARLRAAQHSLARRIRDVGFLPEHEMYERSRADAPFTMAQDQTRYAASRVINAADLATLPQPPSPAVLRTYLGDGDSGVRYWCALGLLRQGLPAVEMAAEGLRMCLHDPSLSVRMVAAEALARYGTAEDVDPAIERLLSTAHAEVNDVYIAIAALNALTEIGAAKLKPYHAKIALLPLETSRVNERMKGYLGDLIRHLHQISA
ncbi:sulfatase-like hydrolase/transferase [Bryobacter aggregatus]|uniref:sulfatase-like hydrolase/transferase n=1 Tax=Bryobacter aggregatus TaxID=360054 RepID=UPI0004E182A8|nr:sulfatase-like hydrolase/transferase [Bryobacter aggregatus]